MRLRFAKQARALNKLRKRIRKAYGVRSQDVQIVVNSWYRSPAYNVDIGGARWSQHVDGRATDVRVYVRSLQIHPSVVADFAESVRIFREGGIGWYDADHGWVTHLDHRAGRARWVNG